MPRRFSHCPECGAEMDPTLPECQACGFLPDDSPFGEPRAPSERARRRRFPIPWGLLIVLGVYFASVWFYVRWDHQNSPEYRSVRHLRSAQQLLGGRDDGRTVELRALHEALDHLLAALRIAPDDIWTHQRVEVVVRRLAERDAKLPLHIQKEVDAASLRYRRMRDAMGSGRFIGPRDLWDLDAARDLPGRMMQYGFLGGLLIFAVWFYWTIQDRKHRSSLEAERQDDRRRDLAGIARQRYRGK